jgi:4-amino-4-deoxy-L-arabinose transferase-like glycosyltransferase
MAGISWQKWEDLIVDYGQQLYTAWQLSEGQVLYKDITYLHGPFSAYLHAIVFKIFGQGILVLAWFNLAVVIGLAFIIYFLFRKLADELTATLTTLAFLMIFAFGQYALGGNYNFICSYVYELPHGVFLSFVSLYQFSKYVQQPDERRLALIGGLMGLIYMTKPEVFLAAFTALATGIFLKLHGESLKVRLRGFFIVGFSFITPLLFLTVYFWYHMPWGDAIRAVFTPWYHVIYSPGQSLPLYKWVTGTNAIGSNLLTISLYAGLIVGIFLVVLLINRILIQWTARPQLFAWPLGGVILVLGLMFHDRITWLELSRPWPLYMAILTAYGFLQYWKNRGRENADHTLTLFIISLFSLVLLFKIILNTHLYHYGFALALPATLLLIKLAIYDFPRWTQRVLGSAAFCRIVASALVLTFISAHAWFTFKIYELKGFPVGAGRDTVVDYHPFLNNRGEVFNTTLEYIDKNLSADVEFATFPDAIMLNYMSRRKSPIRDVNLNPHVWQIVGDEQVLQDLYATSPAYIILVDHDFSYFGLRYFGQDFAVPIYSWITQNYTLEKQIGATPFTGKGFGIQILKRNSDRKNPKNA